MPTFAELNKILAEKKLLLVKDGQDKIIKGGIALIQTETGAIIQNLSKKGNPIRFSNEQIFLLIELFPSLTGLLTRNMETMRRVQGLRARLSSYLGWAPKYDGTGPPPITYDANVQGPELGPTREATQKEIDFVKNLSSQEYAYFESLDPDPKRVVPKDAKELSTLHPDKIPRAFTVVDITNKDKPIRKIFLIELDVGGMRPDEATFTYEVSKAELTKLKAGMSFKTDIRGMAVKNLRVFVSDINKPLSGSQLLGHHIKTIETLSAVSKWFIKQYACSIINDVTLAWREIYLGAMEIESRGTAATLRRNTPDSRAATSAADKMTTGVVEMTPTKTSNGTALVLKKDVKLMSALTNAGPELVAKYEKKLTNIIAELEALVGKAIK